MRVEAGHRVVVGDHPVELHGPRPHGGLRRQPPQPGPLPGEPLIERRALQLAALLSEKPVGPPAGRPGPIEIGDRLAGSGEIVEQAPLAGLPNAPIGDRLASRARVRPPR